MIYAKSLRDWTALRRYDSAMAHTYEELKHKTIAELREMAKALHHDAVQGYTQMNKEHLLPALCKALGIEAHEHHAAALAHKQSIKAKMRGIREARAQALAKGDHDRAHALRREYHHLNHRLRISAKRAMIH
jgi:DNA-binding IclR family transcriptional regulator